MQFLFDSFTQIILFLYQTTGNLGWALIVFTICVRVLLFPLSHSSLKAAQAMKELQPELKKIQKKHKGDAVKLQAAQSELYKKYNVNPFAGCIPQIVQIAILIFLYQVLSKFFSQSEINGVVINTEFFGLALNKPDPTFVLPVLAGVTQLILSIMVAPGGEQPDLVSNTSTQEKVKEANKKEEDAAEMAATMQKQMLFIMPVMTGFIALSFPAGLALYWTLTTVFSIFQQWYVSGWGGITIYLNRLKTKLR
jgi:YidC/Oxa1 family membrane protein insertase